MAGNTGPYENNNQCQRRRYHDKECDIYMKAMEHFARIDIEKVAKYKAKKQNKDPI